MDRLKEVSRLVDDAIGDRKTILDQTSFVISPTNRDEGNSSPMCGFSIDRRIAHQQTRVHGTVTDGVKHKGGIWFADPCVLGADQSVNR